MMALVTANTNMDVMHSASVSYHFSRLRTKPANGGSFVFSNVEVNSPTRCVKRPLATPRDPCVLAICGNHRDLAKMALDVIQLGLY